MLLGVTPGDKLQEKKEFKMKEKYKQDTEQLLKHMKIAGSLEKGTPNMETYNRQVKRAYAYTPARNSYLPILYWGNKFKVSTSTVAAVVSKVALTGQRIPMVDMVLLVVSSISNSTVEVDGTRVSF